MLSESSSLLMSDGWMEPGGGIYGALAVFFFVKSGMLALIVSFPGPTGVFMPTLAAGAVFGRFFGELFFDFAGPQLAGTFVPASFATIGCACMGVSVTHTLSTAVMVVELSGEISLLLPILIGSIISLVISRFVTNKVGLYERIAFDRRLPLMFDLPHRMFEQTASQLMVVVSWELPSTAEGGPLTVIESMSSLARLDAILDNGFDPSVSFPVVESFESRVLLGFVSGYDLLQYRNDILRKLEFVASVSSMGVHNAGDGNNSNSSNNDIRRSQLSRSFSLLHETVLPSVGPAPAVTSRELLNRVHDSVKPIKISKGFCNCVFVFNF